MNNRRTYGWSWADKGWRARCAGVCPVGGARLPPSVPPRDVDVDCPCAYHDKDRLVVVAGSPIWEMPGEAIATNTEQRGD